MKEITYFMMDVCPYCKKAQALMDELMKEHPEYKKNPHEGHRRAQAARHCQQV